MSDAMITRAPKTQADFDHQQAVGWLDFHPEDFCHRCGMPNPVWWIDSDVWNCVMRDDDGNQRWSGIVCPTCFDELVVVWRPVGGVAYELCVDSATRGGHALLEVAGARP